MKGSEEERVKGFLGVVKPLRGDLSFFDADSDDVFLALFGLELLSASSAVVGRNAGNLAGNDLGEDVALFGVVGRS